MTTKFDLTLELNKIKRRYSTLIKISKFEKEKYLDFKIFEKMVSKIKKDLISGRNHNLKDKKSKGDLPHSLYVFSTMMEIVFSEELNPSEVKIGMTAALLHDIGYALIGKEGKDLKKFQDLRRAHMREGAKYTEELIVNGFKDFYSKQEIKKILTIIKAHDRPSIKRKNKTKGYPLNLKNKLLYIHREADRLWMSTLQGFGNDYKGRLDKGKTNPKEHLNWLKNRYSAEKKLYQDDGRFKSGLLFRSKKSFEIYKENLKKIKKKYKL